MNNYTVILANGTFPKSEKALDVLDKASFVVCCDGASNKLIDSGREPNLIIGDLDSIKTEYKSQYQDRLIHISDQMTNDLTKAINWCVENDKKDIVILGATGEREDHTIANIGLLANYHQKVNVKMLTDFGVFIPFSSKQTFESIQGQQVSIFSLDPNESISSKGLKYPLDQYQLQSWWMGTLNEALENSFTLDVKEGSRWMVYILDK
jgi:thiamine pyrophosphokinase